ncbi:hypothetical protein GM526_10065 [Enterococcus avium]|nr:hypothetical protein [Enterococcus avium]
MRTMEINKFSKIQTPVTMNSIEKDFEYLDFNSLDSVGGLTKEYSYSCGDEQFICNIKDMRCAYCEEKIVNHDDFDELVKMGNELKEFIRNSNEKMLKEITGEYYTVLKQLKKNFSNVIPFLGAGISIPAGLPSWPQIIKDMSEGNSRIGRINDHLEQGEYLECFPILYKSSAIFKNKSEVKKYFSEVFWKETYDFGDSNHLDFLSIKAPLIVTTNYDHILEQVAERDYQSYIFLELDDMTSLNKHKAILHLHGSSVAGKKGTMIIDKEDYEKIYEKEKEQRKLQSMFGAKTILFFGYSLDDYYVINEFTKIAEANNNYVEYYALMINQDIPRLEAKSEILKKIKYINLKVDTQVTEVIENNGKKYTNTVDRTREELNTEIIEKVRFIIWYLKNELLV